MTIKTLKQMLTYKRPEGSKAQREFCNKYLLPIFGHPDLFGNYILILGDSPNIMFTAHHDTVHHKGGRQNITKDSRGHFVSNSDCLGADCTTGIWLCIEMIKAGIPGVYVIHAAEEIGCIGSGNLVASNPEWLDDIKACISFDRYGTQSIITHQSGVRTCSEAFSDSLSDALGLGHKSDSGGSYTDSNEYRGKVSECTNLSVGYYCQHTHKESQDIEYLLRLRGALLAANWGSLVFEREPTLEDDFDLYGAYSGFDSVESDDLLELVESYPLRIADWLDQCGINADDLAFEIGVNHTTKGRYYG